MNPNVPGIAHKWVLLDADGVVQSPNQSFGDALVGIAGPTAEAWLARTFRGNGPVITGQLEVLPLLREFLDSAGVDADPQDVYSRLWEGIQVHEDVLELVDKWRGTGHLVALTTNQDAGRARFMKTRLGFDERFDRSFYSCDLAVGKPSASYFERVLSDLQIEPSEAVFIDDSSANVASAQRLGINAHRWERGDDLDALVSHVGAAPTATSADADATSLG
ncbi:HAD-IA family hydrolase [Curtobacterium sp. PhB136]|uniref:HAD family hydrolase n=1 Tax=Curtobacterium sp. PhB136 TaxID=2485181 RepID=UPI00105132C2|nr:HAD-IA family hydrolase [Curtobacterium sp. PhB136]TCK66056.1 putative hydrolase of the HAD superfamily [Curtobacterium sp. PhB136]